MFQRAFNEGPFKLRKSFLLKKKLTEDAFALDIAKAMA